MLVLPHSRPWRVLGNRAGASACPYDVPAGQAPQAFRESSVLRGAGQQMALQGFKLEPPQPKAAPGRAGIHKPAARSCLKRELGMRPALQGPLDSAPGTAAGSPAGLGDRARFRVSWHRHQRVWDRVLGHRS